MRKTIPETVMSRAYTLLCFWSTQWCIKCTCQFDRCQFGRGPVSRIRSMWPCYRQLRESALLSIHVRQYGKAKGINPFNWWLFNPCLLCSQTCFQSRRRWCIWLCGGYWLDSWSFSSTLWQFTQRWYLASLRIPAQLSRSRTLLGHGRTAQANTVFLGSYCISYADAIW